MKTFPEVCRELIFIFFCFLKDLNFYLVSQMLFSHFAKERHTLSSAESYFDELLLSIRIFWVSSKEITLGINKLAIWLHFIWSIFLRIKFQIYFLWSMYYCIFLNSQIMSDILSFLTNWYDTIYSLNQIGYILNIFHKIDNIYV